MSESHTDLLRELSFWRSKAEELQMALDDHREEFEEFSASSKELEVELEAQLSQSERKNKDLKNLLDKTNLEGVGLQKQIELKNEEVHRLQEHYNQQKKEIEEQHILIRQLEQRNDDLERNVRISFTSLKEFENRLNDTIEKNVFLQSEKEELMEAAQRWRDESRDLSQELEIQRNRVFPPSGSMSSSVSMDLPKRSYGISVGVQTDSDSSSVPISTTTSCSTSVSLHPQDSTPRNGVHLTSNGQLTPSMRINALNGIGDLMRAVGALESRLAFIMNSQYQQQQQSHSFRGNNNTTSRTPVNYDNNDVVINSRTPHRTNTTSSTSLASSATVAPNNLSSTSVRHSTVTATPSQG